ncbi:uncharacterized protein LOC121872691 isoform X2 [Homarus americanus]|uniref:uncharacterized protein LOC121872691 isoform X2 n=1 Tax=Homarus americanus TaxID=6706 RepID=UPI001C48A32A|nr:uncharacterized protein LOC121872691 isoform X2 [Homarus americanus]
MRVLVAMTAVMACVRVSEPHEMDTVLTKLHENCTGSLVELLLLQQDIRMSQLVDQQKELVNTVSSIAQMLREALPAKQPTRTYPNTERATADIWIGGRDEDSEGLWLWVTGEPMPKGAPIWGSYDGYILEPGGGRLENCATLVYPDRYYVHDITCQHKGIPLCQKYSDH